ncbi:MAG: hypothetical protein MI861_28385 [Pirellulales bacterium]|nr:hypothetical protein [Pirellulales bacterium]
MTQSNGTFQIVVLVSAGKPVSAPLAPPAPPGATGGTTSGVEPAQENDVSDAGSMLI